MTAAAFAAFSGLRDSFAAKVAEWSAAVPELVSLQEELARGQGRADWSVETPIVFNEALRDIDADSEPAFILVADNPGRKEQLAANRRYLVGLSGKLAEGFFARELGIDFRRDVVIVNKTPVHTPRTAELRGLLALAAAKEEGLGSRLEALLADSQAEMARMAARLHAALGVPLWISGYGELGARGLFRTWTETLRGLYAKAPARLRDTVLVFRHFSMNQFAIELRQKRDPELPLMEELSRIGAENRRRILGW